MPTSEIGTLYLVPTPIGNLEDITLRAVRVLRQVDWIAAEDTRRARVLMQAHDIQRPVFSHHAHNEHRETARLVQRLLQGECGALVTDAGMPGLSDPGFLLAREARRSGARVVVLPGPSAVTTAVVASGFPPEPFLFLGYLPPTASRRRRALEELREEWRTVVLFETPHRLRRSLEEIDRVLGPRPVAVVRELTKIHEEVRSGAASALLAELPESPRGEIVLVLSPLGRATRGGGPAAGDRELPRGGGEDPGAEDPGAVEPGRQEVRGAPRGRKHKHTRHGDEG